MIPDWFPFPSHFALVDGQRLHYVDEGSGETILFLHGNPTWSFLYRHQISDLRLDYRCVAVDHLGFGFSDKPARGDYGMRAHAMRLDQFVQKLDLHDVTLVVQDWGGVIGLGWAVHHKERVKRLVVLNTTGFAPCDLWTVAQMRPWPWGLLMLWPLKIPGVGELFVQGLNGFVRFLLPAGLHHKECLDEAAWEGYLAPYQTWSSRRAHLASVRQIPLWRDNRTWRFLEEIGAELDGWTVRTQLIWGMRDPVFVPWFLEEFERRLPNHAPSVRIDDASHFLQEDTPARITAAIRSFLAEGRQPGARPSAQPDTRAGGHR